MNAYLHEISGEKFTAKDFRTWAGTVLATIALQEIGSFDKDAQAKKNVVAAVERVAERLGNTKSVCRKSYIHPEVINAYLEGSLPETLIERTEDELVQPRSRALTLKKPQCWPSSSAVWPARPPRMQNGGLGAQSPRNRPFSSSPPGLLWLAKCRGIKTNLS